MIYVLTFLATGAILIVAGTALARHADGIAAATGLGRLWIGSVFSPVQPRFRSSRPTFPRYG
jgi:hypothetical protein